MFWQQSSHHLAIYVSNTKRNHIPVVYIYLKMISVRYRSLTYKGM
jgi:hypothetical protein